jgi:hypothetical protein
MHRFAACLLALVLTACGTKADTVIRAGWCGPAPTAQANPARWRSRRKDLAVGDSATIAQYVGSGTQVIARGGLVMPGFADGHNHFVDGGFQLASLELRDAATPQEFVRRIAQHAGTLRPGEWMLGGDWDHTLWPGQPLPRREWIDSVTPNNPVFISRLDGHEALANTAALTAAGVTKATPIPSGGEILHDPKTGEPTGIFKDGALRLVAQAVPAPSAEQSDSALAGALTYAASLGLTATAHMAASWSHLASYRRLERAGRMTLRVSLFSARRWRAVAETIRALGGAALGADRWSQRIHGRFGGIAYGVLLRCLRRLGGIPRAAAQFRTRHANLDRQR